MKRIIAFILIPVMLFLFCACGKPASPASSSEPPESSNSDQQSDMDPGPSDMIIYPTLNAVTPNADASKMLPEDVDLFGLTDQTMQEDLVRILGEPKEIVPNPLDSWGRVTYVYDNMRFTFIETLNDDPFDSPGLYVAEFIRDDMTYPRGIKLGDSLYDVVAKFPQERDYRSETMYGSTSEYTTGFAKLLDYDVLTQEAGNYELLICCGWWPTVCINFDDDLKTESVYIYYHSNGLGYP